MNSQNLITSASCDLFKIPFYQFAQMKKFCPETISEVKANYKREWEHWKATILQVAAQLSTQVSLPFAKPHIESWTNGWQVRAHFFAYFKYEFNQNSAAILSVILNRRRLCVSLDWHCYRADRSQIRLEQYNQWLAHLNRADYADWDLWHGDESEYADFRAVADFTAQELQLRDDQDFFCIGKNLEQNELDQVNIVDFISQSIRELLPLYEACHLAV